MTSYVIGSDHPYPWPKIENFVGFKSFEHVEPHLIDNEIWSYSEKLDGSNLTCFSNGFLASRNKFIEKYPTSIDEAVYRIPNGAFQKQPIDMSQYFDKVADLENRINYKHRFKNWVQVIVYGEFMLKFSKVTLENGRLIAEVEINKQS
jgi:hypothetical protein